METIKPEFLFKDLKSPKSKYVIRALYSIKHLENPDKQQIAKKVEPLLHHGYASVRHAAAVAVIENELTDELLPQIKLMLEDSVAMIREVAVIALGKTSENTEDQLLELLESPHSEMKYQAVLSLAEKDYKSAAPEILKILKNDEDTEIRTNAATALGDLRFKEAIPELMKAAEQDKSFEVRVEAALSAAYMGENDAAPLIIRHLKEIKNSIPPAFEILGELDHPSIIPELERMFKKVWQPAENRLFHASVLAKQGDDSVKNYMISKLTAWTLETRLHAIDRLAYTGKKWAADALLTRISVKDPLERDTLIYAIADLPEPLKTETVNKAENIIKNTENKYAKVFGEKLILAIKTEQ